jgi:exonuclease III
LGHPKAIPSLKDLVRVYKPEIVLLIETLVHSNKIKDLCHVLGYDCSFVVDRDGRSGGLAVLWKSTFNCNIINFSSNFINLHVHDTVRGDWRLTSFWGYSDSARRRQSWNLLRDLASMSTDPWCIIGDFNDLLSSEDKKGGPERPSWLYNGFRNAVSDCSLLDMPLEGYQYTWFKSLGTTRALEERLDRAMHTHTWSLMFPAARLINLVAATSDHSPILLKLENEPHIHPKRSFRFENSWLLDNSLVDMITSNWPYYPATNIPQKLKYCIGDMEAWSKENSPNFRETANKLRRELELIRSTHDHLSDASITNVQNKLSNVLLQEDRYWKQRAKVYWLTDGDKNSKFFHASASARKKRNAIKKLRDTNDILVKDQTGLCNIAQSYFQNLFVPNHGDHAPIVATISQRVTDIDNEMLIAPFTEEEFRQAAFSMHPDKSPGPDGLNPGFYRKFWPLFGREFFEACCSWLEDGQFPPNINDTNIALVAKVDRPESMKDLRPISLCNVVYKILSKVLANRLKRILPTCI